MLFLYIMGQKGNSKIKKVENDTENFYHIASNFHGWIILMHFSSLSENAKINSEKYLLWASVLSAYISIHQNYKCQNYLHIFSPRCHQISHL